MTPSQRIAAITGIGRVLGQETWPRIDLALRQFALPTSDGGWDDRESYVIWMVDGATDDQLAGLSAHLGLPVPSGVTLGADAPFWEQGRLRLFVSHVATCKALAGGIKVALSDYGVCAFVAHSDIEPTREWLRQIEAALATADALLAMLTADFHQSLWTDHEVGVALGRQIPVVPLRLGQDPYGLFGKLQGLPGTGRTSDVIAQVVAETLAKSPQIGKAMSACLVGALTGSRSFSASKQVMAVLESAPYLDSDLAAKMRDSIGANYQVERAFGVPGRIESLIARRGLQ